MSYLEHWRTKPCRNFFFSDGNLESLPEVDRLIGSSIEEFAFPRDVVNLHVNDWMDGVVEPELVRNAFTSSKF